VAGAAEDALTQKRIVSMKGEIEKFFSSPAYAVVGASEDRKKFGNRVFQSMKEREFIVYPVNPKRAAVEGSKCFSTVNDLPDEVKSVITVVPPKVTEEVLVDCIRKGISSVWMQPGSESKDAIELAGKYGISVVHRECVMMFIEPVRSFHSLHRWVKKFTGTYPKE
jgi:uncharacterized protein